MWDAAQYLKYSDERSRPFFDLLARVTREYAELIVDLGCGPGNLTRTLIERWPTTHVVGVDNSPEMLEQARPLAIPGRLDFVQADIISWTPDKPVDLIVCNAALQWMSAGNVAGCGRSSARLRIVSYGTNQVLPRQCLSPFAPPQREIFDLS